MPILGARWGQWGPYGVSGGIRGDIWKVKMVYWTLQTIEHEFRSIGPRLVPLLATRCLYLGELRGHRRWWDGGTSDKTTAWPTGWWHIILPCGSTTLDHQMPVWGWGWGIKGANGCRGHWGLHMKNEDGLLQSTLENSRESIADNRTWAQVNWTYVSTSLGHQMPLLGDMSYWRSAWPKGWPNVKLTWHSTALGH